MKKIFYKFLLIILILTLTIFNNFNIKDAYADENNLYLSGEVCGFDLITDGIIVMGLTDVVTKNRTYSPARDAGILAGDKLTAINNTPLNSKSNLNDFLDGNMVIIEGERNTKSVSFVFYPALDLSGDYRLGIYVKNDTIGIGTVTYYDRFGNFGALGHEVFSEKENLSVIGGEMLSCGITSIIKGIKNKPGEIRGYLKKDCKIADISNSKITGLYGKCSNFNKNAYKIVEIAKNNEINIGTAYAYSNISGENQYYKVSIIKVDDSNKTKNLVIKIDDENLFNISGGIVQGMSGTPLIQNGKIIGAITHVFINDPSRGYGILISNMLENN